MKKAGIILSVVILGLFACERESDFRDEFTGNYKFFVHHVKGDIERGNFLDTNYIRFGFVDTYGKESEGLLEINYGTDTIFTLSEGPVTENSAFMLSSNDSLSYPGGIGGWGHTWLYGEFINRDSLQLFVSFGGRGFWNTRIINASKIGNR